MLDKRVDFSTTGGGAKQHPTSRERACLVWSNFCFFAPCFANPPVLHRDHIHKSGKEDSGVKNHHWIERGGMQREGCERRGRDFGDFGKNEGYWERGLGEASWKGGMGRRALRMEK